MIIVLMATLPGAYIKARVIRIRRTRILGCVRTLVIEFIVGDRVRQAIIEAEPETKFIKSSISTEYQNIPVLSRKGPKFCL